MWKIIIKNIDKRKFFVYEVMEKPLYGETTNICYEGKNFVQG